MNELHLPSPEELNEFIRTMTVANGYILVKAFPTTSSQFRDERPYTPHNLGVLVKHGVSLTGDEVDSAIPDGAMVAYADKDVVELDCYGLPYAYVPLKSVVSYQVKPQGE